MSAGTAQLQRLQDEVQRKTEELALARHRANEAQWQLQRLRSSRAVTVARIARTAVLHPRELPVVTRRLLRQSRSLPPRPSPDVLEGFALLSEAREAMAAHDYETALQVADRVLDAQPRDRQALELRRQALYKLGRITDALDTLVALRKVVDSPQRRAAHALLLGRIHETDPAWLPRIPGPARPVDPQPGRVMHLLKESRPYRTNGFCVRSHYSLRAQQGAGLDPLVVTSLGFPRSAGVSDVPAVEDVDGIRHYRLDLGPGYPSPAPFDVQLRDQAWLTARIAARERPALIQAGSGHRGYETALVGRAVAAHLNLPFVYEVRSFFESTWTGDLDRAEYGEYYERRKATEDRCLLAADAVITIAESMRAEIIARGVPADRVHVVPNGVDPDVFHPRPRNRSLARRFGLHGGPVLGYVSNLDHPREGQEVLIEATAELVRRGREVTCLLVGEGSRRDELAAQAASAGLADHVVFTGPVPHDEIPEVYALIDIFVVPRRDERAARLVTPLKPFEAMATGIPVIVSDLPALTEIIAPGERGLAFPAGDARALADAAELLLDNPTLARRLAEAGRVWVTAERTWAANGPRYRAVYDSVSAPAGEKAGSSR